MPGLVVAGRRFRFGSDDLVYPAAALVVLRFCWTSALVGYLAHVWTVLRRDCASAFVVLIFVAISFIGIASIFLNASLALRASRGVMLSAKERNGVPALLYASCVLASVEAAASCCAMWLAWAPHSDSVCTRKLRDDEYERLGLRIIATTQCVGLFVSGVLTFVAMDTKGSKKFPMNQYDWTSVCESLCACACCATCGIFGGGEFTARARKKRGQDIFSGDIADVASILSVFLGTLDVVPTDIVAGLALVRARQHEASLSRSAADAGEPADEASTRQGARYIDYAVAVYGWKMFTLSSPCSGMLVALKALFKRRVGCCDALDSVALRQYGGGRVLFESFRVVANELVPVALFADDEAKEIVVACRGTLSLADCVTDATARPKDALPGGRAGVAHGGMVRVAKGVCALIDDPLAKALDGERAGYRIVVVGHSLGAGVAALAALALREQYPSTICVAFSPPGALVDPHLAESMTPFCTSFVVGDDVVPRLGLPSLFRLRDNVIVNVARSSKHKRHVVASMFLVHPNTEDLFYSPHHPDFDEANALAQACLDSLRNDDQNDALTSTELTLPGKVVHVTSQQKVAAPKTTTASRCCFWKSGHEEETNATVVADKSVFSNILVSKRMFNDHMPWVVSAALKKCAHERN